MNELLKGVENIVIENKTENDEISIDEIEERIDNIKKDLVEASKTIDYDKLLKKYNIKIIRNGKKSSPLYNKTSKMEKIKILKMAIYEPEDIFNYDFYSTHKK